jgi:hypothetical protein
VEGGQGREVQGWEEGWGKVGQEGKEVKESVWTGAGVRMELRSSEKGLRFWLQKCMPMADECLWGLIKLCKVVQVLQSCAALLKVA